MLNVKSLKDLDLCDIAEYRGQAYAIDAILDIEEFLKEEVEEHNEENL